MSARKFRKSWWVDFTYNFQRYRFKSPLNSKAGAAEYEATLRGRLARGEPLLEKAKTSEQTFASFAERWFTTYMTADDKPSGKVARESILRRHLIPSFGRTPLSAIRGEAIEHYKTRKRAEELSKKTINNHLSILKICLDRALDWGALSEVPCIRFFKGVKLPPFDFLSHEETSQLLNDTQEPMWNLMIRLAVRTGLRIGEVFGLQWDDISVSRGQLTVRRSIVNGHVGAPKDQEPRQVPLTTDLRNALEALPGPHSGMVFKRANGRSVPHSTARKALRRICKRQNMRPLRWHTLRHTYASQLVSADVPIVAVRDLLGHSTVRMTERYAHLAPSSLQRAVAVLDSALRVGSDEKKWQPDGNVTKIAHDEKRAA